VSPLSNLPSWSHVSKPHHVGLRFFILGLCAGFVLALLPWEAMFLWTASRFELAHDRKEERKAWSPQIALAARLQLSYEQVAARPRDFMGKPVVWCVDHHGASYLDGRPSLPVSWSNDEQVPVTSDRHCEKMLAVIEDSDGEGVLLRYLGRP